MLLGKRLLRYWAGTKDINAHAIGIEIVNPGHEFGYRAFPMRQMEAVPAKKQSAVGGSNVS